jgi:hypothetical protein
MAVSIYHFFATFAPMLGNLSEILDKAAEHARAEKLDPVKLVDGRLAPDMYPLAMQIKIACDQSDAAIAQLQGRAPSAFPESGRTLEELKARVTATLDHLSKVHPADLEGSETRTITIPLPDGSAKFVFTGLEFLRDWALPHFYFHVVTAYDILRHNGVAIGKRDYLSHVGRYIRPATPG